MYRIIATDGQQYGPATAEQIRRWLTENRVHAQTLAQSEGAQDWKPLASFAEFAGDFKTPPPLSSGPAPAVVRNPKADNKIAAGICGILLGSFGIHKFILGYTGAGLIMLLVTLLTCFIAMPITHIIGLIEGILYLTKSDEEFVKTYVEQRREWF
jgi:TM2 domain-containing membrane protein YozV